MDKKTLLNKTFFEFGVIVSFFLIALLVFSPTYLNLDFFWDDERFIFTNPYFLNAPNVFSFWLPDSGFFKAWPLGYSIFYFLKLTLGFENLWVYKTLNIFFHSLNAYLLFFLVNKYIKKVKISYISMLFFLAHPLAIENVSWVFQLLTIISTSFIIVSLLFFHWYISSKNNWPVLLASLLFFTLSIQTKPLFIFYPIFLLSYFFFLRRKLAQYFIIIPFLWISLTTSLETIRGTQSMTRSAQFERLHINTFLNNWINTETDFSITRNLLRLFNYGKNSKPSNNENKSITDKDDYYDYLFNRPAITKNYTFDPIKIFSQAVWHYPLKVFMPINLSFIYKDREHFLISLIIIFLILIGIIYGFYRRQAILFLVLIWSIVAIAPFSGISFITFYYWSNVSDRYTYPLILILPFLVSFLLLKFQSKITPIISIALLSLSIQTLIYSKTFNTPELLYLNALENKEHPVFYSNLYLILLQKADLVRANYFLTEGLKKFPNDPNLKFNKMHFEVIKKNYNQ